MQSPTRNIKIINIWNAKFAIDLCENNYIMHHAHMSRQLISLVLINTQFLFNKQENYLKWHNFGTPYSSLKKTLCSFIWECLCQSDIN